ncbi:alpha/beta hydrolase [Treponema pedis]|uniref:Acetyl hydrolase n=1 Tax=Treponema pedis str. T A4 TaxID=1291379 RepID=S5ZQ75_9SPIR|nr:alpha/beta hydrolase [Treponema pedis]AGT44797.1 acetyl hydrolase [Treponema pedis str. T A4]
MPAGFNGIYKLKKQFKKTTFSVKSSLEELRKEYENIFYSPHTPNNVEICEKEFKGIHTDLLRPEMAVLRRTVLYAHGGSFISGSCKSYRSFCASLAHESSASLYLPEYRLAPEYPFPTALEDLYNVYARLADEEKIDIENIILAGDGAGGGLIISLIHYLKSKKLPLPSFVVLLSPWADLSCTNEELNLNRKKDFVFSKDSLLRSAKLYTYEKNLTNNLVSPLFGSFENFPKVYIQCGGHEILYADSVLLKQKIEEAGGSVELEIYKGMPHLFQALPDYFAEAHLAVGSIGKRVNSFFCKNEE